MNVIHVYEINHYYKNCRNEIKSRMILTQILKHVHPTYTGFQIINSCICGASTLLETKENKI